MSGHLPIKEKSSFIDNRVAQLRRRVRSMVEKKQWRPKLKTIMDLEEEYKVTGGFIVKIFLQERKKYLEDKKSENYQ